MRREGTIGDAPTDTTDSDARASATRTRILLLALATCLLATPAAADTTLTVDLGSTIGPVTHAASGSLYGMTEDRPADLDALVAPLRPNMFTNPAENVQQPHGDAILVAARVAPLGARVTIRLADWLPGWPYMFTNMPDWLGKVGQTVSRKQASGLDNYYGYEIWNEPDITWTSSTLSFNDFWKQTYDELRTLDPNAKIIGPSVASYNALQSFLVFARDNDCLPDIVSWHELGGGNVGARLQGYRMLEQQLDIGPLPISINEYSGEEWIDDEGQPGASAPIIAKLERFGVDTACISYWDVPNPGRLGSLLATDSARNGGWWFYKWYGDMSGEMVSTTPPAPNDVSTLDGFANLDATDRFASVVFAGVNDGTIRVVIEGVAAANIFGSTVHVVVEHTPWGRRSMVVDATDTLETLDLPVANDPIEITVSNASDTDGYRIYLTPVDDGSGGTGGAGGAGGSAGAGGTGGTGAAGVSGATGGSGSAGSAGTVAGSGGNAGSAGSAGVMGGSAGSGGMNGTSGSGGMVGVGAGVGGSVAGTGGMAGPGVAGNAAMVGGAAAGGTAGTQAPAPITGNAGADDAASSGCGCRVAGGKGNRSAGLFLLLLFVGASLRGSRRRSSDH